MVILSDDENCKKLDIFAVGGRYGDDDEFLGVDVGFMYFYFVDSSGSF